VEPKTGRSYVAELVGTFLLVFFICMVVSLTSREALGFTDWTAIGLVHALVLALLIAALAGVSGAHFNPAVTIALAAMRKIRGNDAAVYLLMQFAGATLAALLVKAVIEDEGKPVNFGATLVSKAFLSGNFNGMVLELIGTFVLMLAIVGTAIIAVNKSDLTPWIIGGALGMAVMCIGPLTGAGLNPARAFGPMLVGGVLDDEFGQWLVVYTIGPIIGALIAAWLIRYLYPDEIEEAEAVTPPREDIIEIPAEEPAPGQSF
jgi:MIP family channel proteins